MEIITAFLLCHKLNRYKYNQCPLFYSPLSVLVLIGPDETVCTLFKYWLNWSALRTFFIQFCKNKNRLQTNRVQISLGLQKFISGHQVLHLYLHRDASSQISWVECTCTTKHFTPSADTVGLTVTRFNPLETKTLNDLEEITPHSPQQHQFIQLKYICEAHGG